MPQCAVVVFNPPEGEYSTNRGEFGLRAVSPTHGARIAWTDDGSNPVPNGHGFQNPGQAFGYFFRGHLETVEKIIKAIVYAPGYEDSDMVEADYIVHFVAIVPPPRPATPPFFNPPNGSNLTFPFTLHISSPSANPIIYTINDAVTMPSWTHGTHVGNSLDLVLTGDSTVRAICASGPDNQSGMTVGVFTAGAANIVAPAIIPPSEDHCSYPFPVVMQTQVPGAIVIYTINDNIPPSWTHGVHGGAQVNLALQNDTVIRAIAATGPTTVSPAVTGVFSGEFGGGGGGGGFGGEMGVTVNVANQDTIFGGVIVLPTFQPIGGGESVGVPEPLPPPPDPDTDT